GTKAFFELDKRRWPYGVEAPFPAKLEPEVLSMTFAHVSERRNEVVCRGKDRAASISIDQRPVLEMSIPIANDTIEHQAASELAKRLHISPAVDQGGQRFESAEILVLRVDS